MYPFKSKPPHLEFLELIKLERYWNCRAWVKLMEILCWNHAIETSPLQAVTLFNNYAPREAKKFSGYFKDCGKTPPYLTNEEKEEICKLRGIGTNFGEPNFSPFWQWNFPRPLQSPEGIRLVKKRQAELREKQENKNQKRMPLERYWGD